MRVTIDLTPREAKMLEMYLTFTLNDQDMAQRWRPHMRYLNAIKRKLWAAMIREGVQ